MGTGKTTIGRAVAQRLGFQLLDSDHEIERQQQKAVAKIFAEDGEPAFRALERAFVTNGHPATGQVVACGGGLVVQPGILDLLKTKGVVMCLHASLVTILKRTAGHSSPAAAQRGKSRGSGFACSMRNVTRSTGRLAR